MIYSHKELGVTPSSLLFSLLLMCLIGFIRVLFGLLYLA